VQVLLGLGGNQGDVGSAFAAAAASLARRFRLLGCSSVWRTAPLGPPQPEYLNAALLVEVDAAPLALLAFCQRLEAEAGRDRAVEARLGPRALDVDLLLAPALVVASPALTLPHPRLAERRFALLPSCELVPGWVHPRLHRTLATLAATVATAGQACRRVGPFPPAGADR
jgi:2-amino-4-hydroxy-6-hydroxymethyldihydropteridine diphosphokinase